VKKSWHIADENDLQSFSEELKSQKEILLKELEELKSQNSQHPAAQVSEFKNAIKIFKESNSASEIRRHQGFTELISSFHKWSMLLSIGFVVSGVMFLSFC